MTAKKEINTWNKWKVEVFFWVENVKNKKQKHWFNQNGIYKYYQYICQQRKCEFLFRVGGAQLMFFESL